MTCLFLFICNNFSNARQIFRFFSNQIYSKGAVFLSYSENEAETALLGLLLESGNVMTRQSTPGVPGVEI